MKPIWTVICLTVASTVAVAAEPAASGEGPAATAPAAPSSPESTPGELAGLVERIEKKYTDIDTIRADFVQVTHNAVFGDDEQHGVIIVARPARMRWDFEDGAKSFVTDGDTLWVYTRADNQVIRYRDLSRQRTAVDSLLGSLDSLDEEFTIEQGACEGCEGVVLDLTPRAPEQVQQVRLTLDDDLVVRGLRITDPYDAVTDLRLSDVELGVEVPDSTFVFEPPEGAEVVDGGAL